MTLLPRTVESSHSYNAGTEYIGFQPTRKALLEEQPMPCMAVVRQTMDRGGTVNPFRAPKTPLY